MSAPEVRMYAGGWRCDCGWTGFIGHGQTQNGMERQAAEHKAACPLIRLQARWDARDTALRALITRWRAHPGSQHHTGTTVGSYAAGRIDCADELEQAMEVGA